MSTFARRELPGRAPLPWRTIALGLATLFAVTVVAFVIIQLPPGDFVTSYAADLASAQERLVRSERLASVAKEENPGMAIGMMERALKGDVKAMFLIYATHIDLPDQNTLVRPALNKTFNVVQEIYRHAPNNLYADVILRY